MARFHVDYKERFEVAGAGAPRGAPRGPPPPDVAAHFGDLDTIGRNYPDVESYRKEGEGVLFIQLVPKSEKGFFFHGSHTCRWESTGHTIRWKTVSSDTVWDEGTITCTAAGPGRTTVDYRERFEIEMAANRILAKVARPIVQRNISGGIRTYIKTMRAGFASR